MKNKNKTLLLKLTRKILNIFIHLKFFLGNYLTFEKKQKTKQNKLNKLSVIALQIFIYLLVNAMVNILF